MNPLPLFEKIRMKIGTIGFKLFIWGFKTTQEKYWDMIYHQEKVYRESANHPAKINRDEQR